MHICYMIVDLFFFININSIQVTMLLHRLYIAIDWLYNENWLTDNLSQIMLFPVWRPGEYIRTD